MDDPFIDTSKTTSDQQFMLMLLNRIESLEKEQDKVVNYLDLRPKQIPNLSKELYARVTQVYRDHKKISHNVVVKKLQELVPSNILAKIPSCLLMLFCDVITNDIHKYSFAAYDACKLIEGLQDIDEELIEYLNSKLFPTH